MLHKTSQKIQEVVKCNGKIIIHNDVSYFPRTPVEQKTNNSKQ